MTSPKSSNQHLRRTKDKIDDEQQHHQQYDDNDDLLEVLLSSASSERLSPKSRTACSCSANNHSNEVGVSLWYSNSNSTKRKVKATATTTTTKSSFWKAKLTVLRETFITGFVLMIIWAYGYNKMVSTTTNSNVSNIVVRINNNNDTNNVYNTTAPTIVSFTTAGGGNGIDNTDGTNDYYDSPNDDTDISSFDDVLPMSHSGSITDDYDALVDDMVDSSSNKVPVKATSIGVNQTSSVNEEQLASQKNDSVNNDSSTKVSVQDNHIETIEVAFNDLRYRRVCTNVGLYSMLCMTVRFPFQYAAPDDKSTTRRPIVPVAEEFYQLDKNNMYHIQYNDWIRCNAKNPTFNATNPLVITKLEDTAIRQCMYTTAYEIGRKHKDKKEPVVTFWTRERRIPATTTSTASLSIIYFHGTGHTDAVNRIYQFFGPDHELIVMGASPAPGVTQGLHEMLGSTNCYPTYVHRRPNYNCINQQVTQSNSRYLRQQQYNSPVDERRLDAITKGYDLPFSTLNESQINIGVVDYRSVGKNGMHDLPKKSVVQHLNVLQRQPGWTTLRNLTLFIDYPFAHIQTHDMLVHNLEKVHKLQRTLPKKFLSVQDTDGKEQLRKQGYLVQNIIVFDGLPQFYPTESSGWSKYMYFLSSQGFKVPSSFNVTTPPVAFANTCVGPLPKNSLLREINLLSRHRFHELGLNPRFYGRTWEFVNLFWWQMKMYDGKGPNATGLDCTHNDAPDGINGIHRFFVQAMVDDYLENQ